MDYRQNAAEPDELRAEFTAWLNTVIKRAKYDYLRKHSIHVELISLDDIPERDQPATNDDWLMKSFFEQDDFIFEEERLALAYAELPLMRRQILKLLFVDNMKVGEIAKMLNCSPQYVSNQKQKGLNHLRKKMTKGGDANG